MRQQLQINTTAAAVGGSLPPFSPYPYPPISPSISVSASTFVGFHSNIRSNQGQEFSIKRPANIVTNFRDSGGSNMASPSVRFNLPSSSSSSSNSQMAPSPLLSPPNSTGSYNANSSNVMVGVRIRPLTEKETLQQCAVSFRSSVDDVSVQELDERGGTVKQWVYDRAFGPDRSNYFIFEQMGLPLVDAAIDGYNTVMFMYGQTSSGKTYTLFGGDGEAGIVEHAMLRVHQRVSSSSESEFVIKMTYAELYNEEIKDLLANTMASSSSSSASSSGSQSSDLPQERILKIVDDPHLGPLIQNITEAPFTNCAEMKALLEEGERRRHFGVTNMNAHSSRSHVMVRLCIESRKVNHRPSQPLRLSWGPSDRPSCISTLNLVDLAGSERANKSGTSGQSLKEGSFINKSLLTLGTVIANLSEGGSNQHIPYRNSKLTRLLSTALGGNAKTCMISCISPASSNLMESLSTLRFASRAKKIVNVVHKNELSNPKLLVTKLAAQAAEIEQLRSLLNSSAHGSQHSIEEAETIVFQQRDQSRRSLRCLKFMVRNSSRILRGLRRHGSDSLLRKILDDLHLAVLERSDIDLEALMAEHVPIISATLHSDHILLQRLRELFARNESESDVGEDSLVIEPNDWPEGNAMDEEGYRQQIELALLGFEDFRARAINRTLQLEANMKEYAAREQKQKRFMQEMRAVSAALEMDLHLREQKQAAADVQIQQLKEQLKVADVKNDSISGRKGQLEVRLAESEERFALMEMELKSKDAELERTKAAGEQLSRQLLAAQASRKTGEEEFERNRLDMQVQMDRLRSNMHEMLIRGGEKAEIANVQNQELQREADLLRHELQLYQQGKLHLDKEASFLRAELQVMREAERVGGLDLASARDQITESSHRIRELQLEVALLNAAVAASEQENKRLLSLVSAEASLREEDERKHLDSIEALKTTTAKESSDLADQLQQLQLEKDSVANELEMKKESLHKLELHVLNESSRSEKKLALQVKRYETLLQDMDSLRAAKKSSEGELHGEIDQLRLQVKELRDMIHTVNDYLERRQDNDFDGEDNEYVDSLALKENELLMRCEISGPDDNLSSSGDDFVTKAWSPPSARRSIALAPFSPEPRRRYEKEIAAAEALEKDSMDRLILGSQLLTASLKFSLGEDRLIRSSLQQHRTASALRWDAQMSALSHHTATERERSLEESNRDLSQALSSAQRSQRSISDAFEELEKRHMQLEQEHSDAKLSLLEMTAQAEQLSQHIEDCRLFVDRSVHEKSDLEEQQNSFFAEIERLQLELRNYQTQLRAVTEDKYELLNQIGILEQDLGVLQAERDELFKRFIHRDRA